MNITTKWRIGQLVKVYFTPIKEGKIVKDLGCRYGIIDEIKIQLDIITKQPIVLYKLVGNPNWYNEHSLVRYS